MRATRAPSRRAAGPLAGTAARAAAGAVAVALGVALGLAAPSRAGADEAILIGGGHSVHRSEAQIELNALWIREVLERAGIATTVYYTDGDDPGADVQRLAGPDEPTGPLEPLARAFGELRAERTRWRGHELGEVDGPTVREALEPALARDLAEADAAGEPVMLVYNGHGTQSPTASPADVRLELWDGTGMRAAELHALLDDHRSPVRWVFTQCYSGGFHRLAHADPHAGTALAEPVRCGFTAESAYRLAEGCSASIDTDDYRDYSTFFFAALDGRDRDGEVLFEDPDADEDGRVSPREAHLYTLSRAWSSDLSRSTSEDFLDAWQPWWLRWLPAPARVPENEYAALYRELGSRVGIPLDEGVAAIRANVAALEGELDALATRRDALREEEQRLGELVAGRVADRWPALYGPYTSAYAELVASGRIEDVVRTIEAMPEYPELVAAQDADAALDTELVEAERALVQHAKLLRFRRLATLVDQLERWGDGTDRTAYAELLACESAPLGSDGTGGTGGTGG